MFKKSNLKFMKSFFLHTHLFWLKYEYAMVKCISINSFENLLAFTDLNWYLLVDIFEYKNGIS